MKMSKLTKPIWISAVAVSLLAAPLALSASAQTGTGTAPDTTTAPGTTGTTTAPGTTTTTVEDDNDGFDWGLLGLLGLIGLAGLARRSDDRVRYRDPAETDPTSTTRTDYRR